MGTVGTRGAAWLRTETGLLALVVALAAVLRLATLRSQSLWVDEWFTVREISQPLRDMLRQLPVREATPPLFFVVEWIWSHVAAGDAALRLPSALAGIATVAILFRVGVRAQNLRTGVILGLLAALSPLLVWYSQEARSYALLTLWSALALLALVELERDRRPVWLAVWAGACALAITTHHFGGFLAAASAVWLLISAPRRRFEVLLACVPLACVAVAMAPTLFAQQDQVRWIATIDGGERAAQLPQHALVGLSVPTSLLTSVAAVAAVAAIALVVRASPLGFRAAILGASVAGLGLLIAFVAALTGNDYVITRNLIELWPAVALVLAVGLGAERGGWTGVAVAGVLLTVLGATAVWSLASKADDRPDWDAAAAAIPAPRGGTQVVLAAGGYNADPLLRYLAGHRPQPGSRVSTTDLTIVDLRAGHGVGIGPCWWGVLCTAQPSNLAASPPPGFRPAGKPAMTERTVVHRFVAARPRPVPIPSGVGGAYLRGAAP